MHNSTSPERASTQSRVRKRTENGNGIRERNTGTEYGNGIGKRNTGTENGNGIRERNTEYKKRTQINKSTNQQMKNAYIILADGFELIEAMAPYDVFCRGGINVKSVSISGNKTVSASNKVKVTADLLWDEANFSAADLIYLPGGYPGYENLGNDPKVGAIAKQQYESGKLLAAICGAPTVLLKNSIALGKTVTSHSCCADQMSAKYHYTGKPYEHDGNLWTAIGAGHSQDFAIALAQVLAGDEAVAKIKKGMELKF